MPLATTTRMLVPFLDRLTGEELDAIPFGIAQLDAMGTVRAFNRAEADNCSFSVRPIGLNYFLDVHPSANAPEFYGRFLGAVEEQRLDETFPFTFICAHLPRRVLVRMYYSVRTSSVWVFTAKPDGSALDHHHAAIVSDALRATGEMGVPQLAEPADASATR
jgi:two-component system, chemotaxis family, sensor kinase Cph1